MARRFNWVFGAWLLATAGLLGGCGGGGGGDDASRNVSMEVITPQVNASAPERAAAVQRLSFRLSGLRPGQPFYIGGEGGEAILADAQVATLEVVDTLDIDLVFRSDLPVGRHADVVTVRLCADAGCVGAPLAGPVQVPISLTVTPNIAVLPPIDLARTGDETPPHVVHKVGIPPEAGQVTISTGGTEAVRVELVGDELRISAQEIRSGEYTLPLDIYSMTDSRYRSTTTIRYVVSPPAGGERPMTLSTYSLSEQLANGQRIVRRITAQRATWSSVPLTPHVDPTYYDGQSSLLQLVPAGGEDFDIVIDASGVPTGRYSRVVMVEAQGTGMQMPINVEVHVDADLRVARPPFVQLDATSTAADLRWSSHIAMADGSATPWSATSDMPWLLLERAQGVTGINELAVRIDPVARAREGVRDGGATITISVDRPGVAPLKLGFGVDLKIPVVWGVGPGAMIGTAGRLVVRGLNLQPDDVAAGRLVIGGAQVRAVNAYADPRFVGYFFVLALDVDGAEVGRPITVTAATPVLTTSAHSVVRGGGAAAAGVVPWALGDYRPPVYSTRHDAWYGVGAGRVWRYAFDGMAWQMSSVPLAGAIDLDLNPDETRLIVAADNNLVVMDPANLSTLGVSAGAGGARPDMMLDPTPHAAHKTLVQHVDGGLFAAARTGESGGRTMVRLIDFPSTAPPPTWEWPIGVFPEVQQAGTAPIGGYALLPSPSRRENVAQQVGVDGDRQLFRLANRSFGTDMFIREVRGTSPIVGMGSDGQRFVQADGVVHSFIDSMTLEPVLEPGRVADAYALLPNGQRALIYTYQPAGVGLGALSPELLLVKLGTFPTGTATVEARLPLPQAVGCLADRPAAEPCRHGASLTLDPAGRMAAVVGPRGLVVVPLPEAARASSAPKRRGAAALGLPARIQAR